MSQILVPVRRQDPPVSYVGRHREPDVPPPPPSTVTRARDLAELEGPTRDLRGPAGLWAAARAVWFGGVR